MPTKAKKRKVKSKYRPPRIFIKKGKMYIKIGKKKYLLKDQDDYTKRELMDIILKELLVRRKRTRRGKTTRKEKTKNKKDLEVFKAFEKLNNNQSKHLRLPTSFIKSKDNVEHSMYMA